MTIYSREAGMVFACLVSGNAGAFFEMEISELTRAGKRTADETVGTANTKKNIANVLDVCQQPFFVSGFGRVCLANPTCATYRKYVHRSRVGNKLEPIYLPRSLPPLDSNGRTRLVVDYRLVVRALARRNDGSQRLPGL